MKRITIVGAGALGSHLVMLLRNLDAALCAVDFDRVESKNLAAQFHSKQVAGQLKALALQRTMGFLFGRVIAANTNRLTGDNVSQLLDASDLVVDCVDNGATRRLIQDYVRAQAIPCVHGALAADGAFGRVTWDKHFVVDDEGDAGAPTCENGEHLPFIVTVASFLAQAVQQFMKTGKQTGYQVLPTWVMSV